MSRTSEDTRLWQVDDFYEYFGRETDWPPSSTYSPLEPESFDKRDIKYPQRPGERPCKYYMQTGKCKYGMQCKFDHPLNRRMETVPWEPQRRHTEHDKPQPDRGSWDGWESVDGSVALQWNPRGLPRKPNMPQCQQYMATGLCRHGVGCSYDHPGRMTISEKKSLEMTQKKAGKILDKVELAMANIKITSRPTSSSQEEHNPPKGSEWSSSQNPSDWESLRTPDGNASSNGSQRELQSRPDKQGLPKRVDHYLAGNPAISGTCDMFLQVEDWQFPVSSSLLVIHSQVLGRKYVEAKKNPSSTDNVPITIYLHKENKEDIELLLEFLYCARTKIEKVEEAACLLRLAEKYKVTQSIATCEQWLCQEIHRMHIGRLPLSSTQTQPTADLESEEQKNWSLGKWLQLSERLNMNDLKGKCLCALTGVFFSKAIQSEGMLASVISDLTEENKVSARSLAEVISVMGMWVNTLGHYWACRNCGLEGISRGEKCSTCGKSYQQDRLQFGLQYMAELMPLFAADEEIVLQMFKSICKRD